MSFQIPNGTAKEAAQSQKTNAIEIYNYDKLDQQHCYQCKQTKLPKYYFINENQILFICGSECLTVFENEPIKTVNHCKNASIQICSSCGKKADDIATTLDWQLMSFCNGVCLIKYQRLIGSKCVTCRKYVESTSLGKYSIRFGNKIRQFCSNTCLEQRKKDHKLCPFCQQEIISDQQGFWSPVGQNSQIIRFCSNVCCEKYDVLNRGRRPFQLFGIKCFICNTIPTSIKLKLKHNKTSHYFCGKPCFLAFAFVNKISSKKCSTCRRYFNKSIVEQCTMYYDNVEYSFCSKSCKNFFVVSNKKIAACNHCKVKKYNFDLIKKYSKTDPITHFCSIDCLNLYRIDAGKQFTSGSQLHEITKVYSLADENVGTLGVTALQRWIKRQAPIGQVEHFETDILQLNAIKLDFYLCSFVKEVRNSDGQKYTPDLIYYLCLGIQKYLFENGRIDNIFYDPYYKKFTKCLDEVAKKFSILYNDSQYITTTVKEEHLWESNQLGTHSPHVILNTLLFFNKKHFNLTTLDEHKQLSFSHIIKCIPNFKDPHVLLKFFPPSQNQRKRKVYMQQENKENSQRCPIKLYNFYLSKCPESVKTVLFKTGNDAFYLQPESSYAPDSPVWFSTMPLFEEALEQMLHRLEMVAPFRHRIQ